MLRFAAVAALLPLLGACNDDGAQSLEPAPLAAVCGVPGPFHLLSLPPDVRVGPKIDNFAVIGERLLFIASKPSTWTSTVYAVGPCGEDPVVVAHDIDLIYEDPLWPGVALGCTTDDDLMRLDPSGAIEPILLAAEACPATITKHGILHYVSTDDHRYSAELFPLVDPAGPVLGPPSRVAEPVPVLNALTAAVRLLPDEVLLIEANGDLVSVALPGLTRTFLEAEVVSFATSPDGRYLLYQVGATTITDPYNPIGTIQIRDRNSGLSVPVGTGSLGLGYPQFRLPGIARVNLSSPTGHDRIISLTDFTFTDAPEGHELVDRLPNGRWLTRTDDYGPWYVLDLEAGQATLLIDGVGLPRAVSDAHIDLLVGHYTERQTTLPLVRVFLDGREPRRVADRANHNAIVREDGRILTMVDVDDELLGELTLVDPATRVASRIDERVVAAQLLHRWVHPSEPDTIVYSVADGDRTGVWLARPTPIDGP